MTTEIESAEQAAFIEMVASRLTSKFIPEICFLCNRKNFCTHAGILAEIFEWSIEFFQLYYVEFSDNAEPADIEEAAIAFGYSKFNALLTAPTYLDKYFLAKYRTMISPFNFDGLKKMKEIVMDEQSNFKT